MNYQKVYESIIVKAKSENRIKHNKLYFEEHHIIPKCLGGNDEKINLVLLTAREHFICHKLLMYIHKENTKLAYAYCMLAFDKNSKRKISAREYQYAREVRKIPHTQETKEKISKSCKNKNKHGNYSFLGKHHTSLSKSLISNALMGKVVSEETKRKMSESKKGINLSTVTREKMSKSKIGSIGPNKGKKFSDETKRKMSESRKGKKYNKRPKI